MIWLTVLGGVFFRKKVVVGKADISGADRNNEPGSSDNRIQRLFQRLPWLYYSSPNRVSAATQTAGVRRSAGTQTEQGEEEEEEHFV